MQFKNNAISKILAFSLIVIAAVVVFQNCGQFEPIESQKTSNSNKQNQGPLTDLPNHQILYGYYYADGRYGNFLNEVSDFTNLYVAIPKGYLTETDWRPQFRSSIQQAVALNKSIFLLLTEEPDWAEMLNIIAPYWNYVQLVELYHEADPTPAEAEAAATRFNNLLRSRGLALKPLGLTYTTCQILSLGSCRGDGQAAPSISWVGIEAYVDPPGNANSQVNVNAMNNLLDQAKARVLGNKKIVMIMMAYDRNGLWTNRNTLADLQMPAYLKSHLDPRVSALLMFSYARPGGAKFYPELLQIHRDIGKRILSY